MAQLLRVLQIVTETIQYTFQRICHSKAARQLALLQVTHSKCSTTVVDATAPDAPTINEVDTNATEVNGTAETKFNSNCNVP